MQYRSFPFGQNRIESASEHFSMEGKCGELGWKGAFYGVSTVRDGWL
jgi:hypothetical protein